jgi:hypothetical protein
MKAQSKTMRTIITSNSWPLRRALCTLLMCIAALWAMPRSAHAQLYISENSGTGTIGEYDANTGKPINSILIMGLGQPLALALSGNNLFVPNYGAGTLGKYDATTGAPNTNFSLNTGVGGPGGGLALSGNNLFVSSEESNTVGEYSATTGHAINASFITTGLSAPSGLALSGNDLFVANAGNNTVGKYNATTAVLNPNFSPEVIQPYGLAVASVPEPSAWSMIAVGGVALLGIVLRKKHRIA